ncbi:MAG: nitroreductase family deazaflavin-dependent oxidoreductase [Mycobacterium sp.]
MITNPPGPKFMKNDDRSGAKSGDHTQQRPIKENEKGKSEPMNPQSVEVRPPVPATVFRKGSVGRRMRRFLLFRVLRPPFLALGRTRGIQYVAPGVRALDGFLYRRHGGRVTTVGLAGLPSLTLHVHGRRTGREYRVPLLCLRCDDGYIVVGSNWGRPEHPDWTTNLMAAPFVTVNYRGRLQMVKSRLIEGSERELVWPHLVENWPGYRSYANRLDCQWTAETARGRT